MTFACACAYTPTTSLAYHPIPVQARTSLQPRLIVKPLSEARPPRSYPSAFGAMFKTYIPLLPYVRIPYERLDETSRIHEQRKEERNQGLNRSTDHFTVSIAQAIADDLRSSGLFREVVFDGPGVDASDAYVLDGDLKSTEFDQFATSYMLGMAGVLLWILPIPCGEHAASVEADLRLSDPQGRVVWKDALSGRGKRLFTLYNSSGAPVSSRFRLEIKRYGSNREGIDGNSLWAYHASAIRLGMEPVKRSLAGSLDSGGTPSTTH
jgi:hypothetical protein